MCKSGELPPTDELIPVLQDRRLTQTDSAELSSVIATSGLEQKSYACGFVVSCQWELVPTRVTHDAVSAKTIQSLGVSPHVELPVAHRQQPRNRNS